MIVKLIETKMAHTSFNRLYSQFNITDDRESLADNWSNYSEQLKQAGYNNIWQEFNNTIINELLDISPEELDISTETYTTAMSTNESDNLFPLPILLEESWWNVFDEKYLRHSWEWTVTLITAYMIILIAGVTGNCMVILVVLFRPQMRTVTNMFIMNLAVADLSVIIFCVGPTLLANIFQPWILGSFMCKGVAYIQGVSVCASAYSLVAISLDRCYAVYRPLHRYRGISKSQALKAISLIWTIALSLTLPWVVIFNIVVNDSNGLVYCQETWENEYHGNLYFLIANLMLCYGIPVVIISVSNVIAWCNVDKRNVPLESSSAAILIKRVHERARENARKMLSIVTLTFLINWLPLYILVTRLKFATEMSESEHNLIDKMMPFAQWLGSSNSCINPILYAFLNKKFREEFHLLLPSCFRLFQLNKTMGFETGRYVSTRNSSNIYIHSGRRLGIYRNSGRIYRGHQTSPNVRVHNFRKATESICTILPVVTIHLKNDFASVITTNNFTDTRGTSGIITDL